MALDPNVVVVAPNELITAQHLNNVRSNLDRIDNRVTDGLALKVAKAGDSMSGNLQVGNDPSVAVGMVLSPAGPYRSRIHDSAAHSLNLWRSGTSQATGQVLASFNIGAPTATTIGAITIASGTSVAYQTTSDRRLKERVGDVDDAADLVAELGAKAYRGRWIADGDQGREWVFLNSQDVEQVAPYAVNGDGDGVDDDGKVVAQQVDYSALVPLLFAALGQALDRIAALEAAS